MYHPATGITHLTRFFCLFLWISTGVWSALYCEAKAAAPPIRSAVETDYPPFSIVDENGVADGFSVELMRAALAAMKREVTFRTGPWGEVRSWLERGDIQALPLVGHTPEREKLFDFTFPYMTLHGAIVVRHDYQDIQNLEDLRGRRVAVMKGDNIEEFLRRKDRGMNIHTTGTFEVALQELSRGLCDAVVIPRLVGLRLIQKTGLTDLHIIDKPIEEFQQDFCFAVREGDRETLALLNEGLAIVVADGTYRHLHAKWFAAMQLPSNRPIVIGGDRNYPPYEFLDKHGKPAGYNVDLVRAVARELDLNIEIRLGKWNERIQALAEGKIDLIQGMSYSPRRDLTFDFSPAHAVSHYVAVVRKGERPAPESIEALKQMRIVVQGGDILHDFVLGNGLEKQVVALCNQETALRELSEGKHDCALVSRMTALYLMDKQGWSNLVLAKKPLLTGEYCCAVVNGRKALLAQFSEGLKALEKSGEYRRIYDQWFGVYEQQATPLRTALRYSVIVIILLLLALLIAFTWSWLLRHQVAEKTKALQESLEQFKHVFEAANVGKSMIFPSGKFKANHAFADLLGYTLAELEGKTWQEVTLDEDIQICEKISAALLAKEKDAARLEKRYVHKNGDIIWADVSVAIRRDSEGRPLCFMSTVVDITERKKAEAEHEKLQSQLVQVRKMESVGRLAGGVAHDFNNMLNVIIGYTELALGNTNPDDPLHKDLEEILGAALRSADITRQLLAFARQQTINPQILDLNETVEGMLKMLRRLIGEDIDLIWRPCPELKTVYLDASQLDQILANLCVNARDAISDVGKITIETGKVRFDTDYCADHAGFVPGDFVMLAVSDNGRGMGREEMDNLFEPFFTTKSIGEGTGLGLATVYGIVKQNAGFINVYSEAGNGSTFTIYLPVHTGEKSESHKGNVTKIPVGRGETILVVEDEASILKLTQKMLDGLNYRVLTAATPTEAVDVAHGHKGKIHLLLTDVIMPGMNGPDLTGCLRTDHPAMKVLFMSGYTANVIAHRGVLDKGVNFIQKPFSKKDLAIKIKKILEGPGYTA
jgi:two-component system sensor histidine kinase EvgS